MEIFSLLKFPIHRRISLSNISGVIHSKLTIIIKPLSYKNLIILATRTSLNFQNNQRFLRSSFQLAQIAADPRKTNPKNFSKTTITLKTPTAATHWSISRNCFMSVWETDFWIFSLVVTSLKQKSAQLVLSKSRHKQTFLRKTKK